MIFFSNKILYSSGYGFDHFSGYNVFVHGRENQSNGNCENAFKKKTIIVMMCFVKRH